MKKILIVDDEKRGNIPFLMEALDKKGFLFTHLTSAHKALETLQSELFDLIILDIMMPIPKLWSNHLKNDCENGLKTGLVLHREIRNANPSIPVLIYSSVGEIQISDKYTTYLRKPELNETIIEKIDEMLGIED